jgi:hypothetical protein
MRTLLDAADREAILGRLATLTPTSPRQWGSLSVTGMLCHLQESTRMALGEVEVKPRGKKAFQIFPLKQLLLYVVPFPKGAPTAPELLQGVPAVGRLHFRNGALRRTSTRITIYANSVSDHMANMRWSRRMRSLVATMTKSSRPGTRDLSICSSFSLPTREIPVIEAKSLPGDPATASHWGRPFRRTRSGETRIGPQRCELWSRFKASRLHLTRIHHRQDLHHLWTCPDYQFCLAVSFGIQRVFRLARL